jgi:NADPH-dependent 2,4-dienoyl-CoA reductase/sulfur reductase-like enzyme
VRVAEHVRALAARCPHHGAPMADGLLDGNRLLCPWHQAVFDADDGSLVEPPALECLESYDVEIDGDEVLVSVPAEPPCPADTAATPRASRTVDGPIVIVGGGAAGLAAAQELRSRGFDGRLVMITDESKAPYDRTQCSKLYLAGEATADGLPLKSPSYYADAKIELVQHRVDRVDVESRRITMPGGAVLEADGLLLATGCRPVRPPVRGTDLDGVMTLRSWTDSDRLAKLADQADRIVVVGGSFIAMEAAASLCQRGVENVTVVAPEPVPFVDVLGPHVGAVLAGVHRDNGVVLEPGRRLAAIEGNGRVRAVVLDGGDRLDADLVVLGTGVSPATEPFAGVDLRDDGSIQVDGLMRVRDGVYAAGDIATFPDWRTGEPTRIEHWRTAQQQGMVAGCNLAGEEQRLRSVPFFWTMQFDAVVGYVGHASSWEEIVVHGEPDERDFMAYFVRDDRVLAAAAMGRNRQLNALHELMQLEREPLPGHLRVGELDLTGLLGA